MSCKLFPAGHSVAAAPMNWTDVSASRSRSAPPPSAPHDDDARRKSEAERQFERHMAAVQAQHSQALEEMRQAGFRDGERAGAKASEDKLSAILERAAQTVTELSGLRSKLRSEAQGDLVMLAIAIARRILHRELQTDPEAIGGVASAALDRMQLRDLCTIRTHPQHENYLRVLLNKLGAERVQTQSDPALALGAILLETGRASLDASTETQLKEIERGFADRLSGDMR